MELNYQGIKLQVADQEKYQALANKANAKQVVSQIKTNYNHWKIKHQASYKRLKKQCFNDVLQIKIKIIGTKEKLVKQINQAKIKTNNQISELKRKTSRFQNLVIKQNTKAVNEEVWELKQLIQAKNILISPKMKIEKKQNKILSQDELTKQINIYKEKLKKEIAVCNIKSQTKIQELNNLKHQALILARKNWKENKTEWQAKWKAKRKDYRVKISQNYKLIKKSQREIIKSRIFLNIFYQPIIDQSTKDFKRLTPNKKSQINWKFWAKQKWSDKIKAKESKLNFLLDQNNNSFDWKAKVITYKYQIEHYQEIQEVEKKYHLKIEQAQLELANLQKNYNFKAAKLDIEGKQKEIDNKFKARISVLKSDYKQGKFAKSSYRNELKQLKTESRDEKRSLKNQDLLIKTRQHLRFLKIAKLRAINKQLKIMNSLIDDALAHIPTRTWKYQKQVATLSSLLIPGLGQICNKQYLKGLLCLIWSGFIYGLCLPLALGLINYRGLGIFGLNILSPSHETFVGTIYEDARFRIVEGIIAIFALVIIATSLILASRDAYFYAKAAKLGLRPKNGRDLKRYFQNHGLPYILSIPAVLAILMIVILPLMTTIFLAFTNYSTGHIPPGNPLNWVGIDNFLKVFSGPYAKSFGFVASWTIIWTLAVSLGVIFLGTFLAFTLDQKRIKGKIFFSTIYILPWAVPAFATILFFSAAFGNGGLYNQVFNTGIDFKNDANWTKALLITIQIWLGHSYIFLLMLGVKKSISADFYDAASIDGASKWKQFLTISAPLILTQIAPLLIGQIVFNFNNYGIIWMFNDGGPATSEALIGNPGSTDIFISLIFKMTTSGTSNRIALASAFTIVISIFVVLISALGFVRSKAFRGESDE